MTRQGISPWLLGALVFATAWAVTAFPSVSNWWIRLQVREHARLVRQSGCSLPEKERLLDRLDVVEGRIDDGASIGLLRWHECSRIVEELCEQGITSDEVRLIERELAKLERN